MKFEELKPDWSWKQVQKKHKVIDVLTKIKILAATAATASCEVKYICSFVAVVAKWGIPIDFLTSNDGIC